MLVQKRQRERDKGSLITKELLPRAKSENCMVVIILFGRTGWLYRVGGRRQALNGNEETERRRKA